MIEITVDEERCCSSGNCSMLAPEVFDQREKDGVVFVLEASPPARLHDLVAEAARVCPSRAIRVKVREESST